MSVLDPSLNSRKELVHEQESQGDRNSEDGDVGGGSTAGCGTGQHRDITRRENSPQPQSSEHSHVWGYTLLGGRKCRAAVRHSARLQGHRRWRSTIDSKRPTAISIVSSSSPVASYPGRDIHSQNPLVRQRWRHPFSKLICDVT
jgi:hypothetical protein